MIVSSLGKLVFFHNPKAAGASVHKSLAPYHDGPVRGWTIAQDGTEQAHYMIDQFAERFPDEWARIADYQFFALFREVRPRFFSSLAQYSRIYGDIDIRFTSPDATRRFLFDTMDKLSQYGTAEHITAVNEFTAFRPQWMYCRSDKHDVDVQAYAVRDMEKLYQAMESRMGVELDRVRINEREGFSVPGPLEAALKYRSLTKRLATMPGARAAKQMLARLSQSKNAGDKFKLSDAESSQVDQFLAAFYKLDVSFVQSRMAANESASA